MNENTRDAKPEAILSRREALKMLGAAGAVVVGSMLGGGAVLAESPQAEAPTPEGNGEQTPQGAEPFSAVQGAAPPARMETVSDVQTLLTLNTSRLSPNALAYVAGYYAAGDGGGKLVRWVPDSMKPDNGGTVHRPTADAPGAWETLHDGVADFRWFGLFGPAPNADDALDAMANDPSIRRIEAHTDLNFVRRHVFRRSFLEIDFGGRRVTTDGIELNTLDNPFGAVLFFQGTPAGPTTAVALSAAIPEGSDIFEVPSASMFAVDDWWIAQISALPGGRAQRELDYLVKVTEIVDATHIRVNYKCGWTLDAGRTISYKKMNPVFRCHVRNMSFVGVPVPPTQSTSQRPFETWDQIGSNPVAYEFAVECDVSGVRATKVFWPVVQRRYNSHYVTESCELINPEERDWGGTGYLTQQLNVLYGNVRNCNTSNARHLNDFTCAAYCLVENCHGDGDDYGPFVTHGQFEHDLVYIGNSGLLSFANSGTHWGDSAKRITVKKHIATRIVANKKLTDLTLEDCYAISKASLANSGSIWANVDGLQMRGCTAENMITLSQSSSRTRRPNVIDGCSFGMLNGYEIARPIRNANVGLTPVEADVTFANCEFRNVENVNIGSIRRLTLTNCWFRAATPAGGIVRVGSKEVAVVGGGFENCGFVFTGAWDRTLVGEDRQRLSLDGGAALRGTNGEKAFVKYASSGAFALHYGSCESAAGDAATAHFHVEGGRLSLRAVGARFEGGRYAVAASSFGPGSYFFISGCVEERVDRSALPPEGNGISHSGGNLILS
ncbi:hypothetical protein [Paenibacillus antri]|uniref:hypothetical protein n=1 Tax=Paenibacillus antri TaxID=2582848 RepID=UPI00192E47B0|nr:hypothetical protein [Paenibacillus antri]